MAVAHFRSVAGVDAEQRFLIISEKVVASGMYARSCMPVHVLFMGKAGQLTVAQSSSV